MVRGEQVNNQKTKEKLTNALEGTEATEAQKREKFLEGLLGWLWS